MVYANPLLASLKHRTEVTLKLRTLVTSCAQQPISNRAKIGLHKPVHNVVSAKRADTGGSCSIFSEKNIFVDLGKIIRSPVKAQYFKGCMALYFKGCTFT